MAYIDGETYQFVKKSRMVNAKWYKEVYPDVARSGMDPIAHFLKYGWVMKRKPCKRFDTDFYIRHYGEEVQGENPLLHYLLHGAEKGYQISDDSKKVVSQLAAKLWSGHSESSIIELEKIKNDPSSSEKKKSLAIWHLARWQYFNGDFTGAYELSLELTSLGDDFSRSKESYYLKGFCELYLDDLQKSRETIGQYVKENPHDADAMFAYANTFRGDDEERLRLINKAYAMWGFSGVSAKNLDWPLALNNVIGNKVTKVSGSKKVSIVMPIYNAEDKIETAIGSLLEQSYRNIEIIAVDDCSTDGTFSLIKSISERDSRVVPLQPPKNGGAYAARNYGLKFATGDLITTHDSDDWSHPQKIETQVKYLEDHSDVKGCSAHWIRAKEDLEFTQNWRPNNTLIHWSQSSFMFRREVLETIGEWDYVRIGGDTEYIWRMQAHYGKESFAKILPEVPLAFALDEGASLTRTKATHVKTVYFGLRHIYREICAWWHSTGQHLHVRGANEKRIFPAPRSMFEKTDQPFQYDLCVAGDFSRLEDCQKAEKQVRQYEGGSGRIALFHWPAFDKKPESLCNLYFELLEQGRVEPVVMGQSIECKRYNCVDLDLARYKLDGMPEIKIVSS